MATKSNTQTTQKGGPVQESDFKASTSARHAFDRVFAILVFAATMVGLVEVNISNLAGVPSIIYGLLGLGIFVNLLGSVTARESILSGALTLSLLILPIIIIATREALRTIPASVREGGYALGATKWEVIRSHLLPMALPGALTGTILALSRAIGETAPLIVVGAATYITFAPDSP